MLRKWNEDPGADDAAAAHDYPKQVQALYCICAVGVLRAACC